MIQIGDHLNDGTDYVPRMDFPECIEGDIPAAEAACCCDDGNYDIPFSMTIEPIAREPQVGEWWIVERDNAVAYSEKVVAAYAGGFITDIENAWHLVPREKMIALVPLEYLEDDDSDEPNPGIIARLWAYLLNREP